MKKTFSFFKKMFWADIRFANLVTDLSYSWESVLEKEFSVLMDSVTAVGIKKKNLPDLSLAVSTMWIRKMGWRSKNLRICAIIIIWDLLIVVRENELAEDTGGKVAFRQMEMNDCCEDSFPLGSCRSLVANTWREKMNLDFEHPKSKQTQR